MRGEEEGVCGDVRGGRYVGLGERMKVCMGERRKVCVG